MPVTLVAGERDAKFLAHRRAMARAATDAPLVVVPGAGHAVQLEDARRGRRGNLPVRIAFLVGLRVVVVLEVLFE